MALTFRTLSVAAIVLGVVGADAGAQPLGSFSWQLAPYCNLITVSVTQDGSIYTLVGYDNQCGAAAHEGIIDDIARLREALDKKARQLRLEARAVADLVQRMRLPLTGGPEFVDEYWHVGTAGERKSFL